MTIEILLEVRAAISVSFQVLLFASRDETIVNGPITKYFHFQLSLYKQWTIELTYCRTRYLLKIY